MRKVRSDPLMTRVLDSFPGKKYFGLYRYFLSLHSNSIVYNPYTFFYQISTFLLYSGCLTRILNDQLDSGRNKLLQDL